VRNSLSPFVLTRVEFGIIFRPQELWARHFSHDTHSVSHFSCVPNNHSTLRFPNHWHITYVGVPRYMLDQTFDDLTKYIRLVCPLGTRFFRLPSFRSTPLHPLFAYATFRLSTPDLQTAGCSRLSTSNLYQPLFTIEHFTEITARFTICEIAIRSTKVLSASRP